MGLAPRQELSSAHVEFMESLRRYFCDKLISLGGRAALPTRQQTRDIHLSDNMDPVLGVCVSVCNNIRARSADKSVCKQSSTRTWPLPWNAPATIRSSAGLEGPRSRLHENATRFRIQTHPRQVLWVGRGNSVLFLAKINGFCARMELKLRKCKLNIWRFQTHRTWHIIVHQQNFRKS